MLTLFHHPMSTGSRYARLILNEYDIEVELIEENSWSRRKEFLALNPAGTLPVIRNAAHKICTNSPAPARGRDSGKSEESS